MSRAVETGLVDDFLNPAAREPAALVIEGEAGIGKTTMWLAILDRAREQGAQVLSARTAAAESALGYGVLADLLDELDDSVLASLPDPQRIAMERILLQVNVTGPITDQRAVAAGFLSVIEILAARGGIVLAIDDLQWLDASTQHVVGFAARRCSGAVRLLATVRTEPGSNTDTSWLQLPRPDAIQRIGMRPLTIGGLHAVISDRLGRSFARPTMKRIHETSGGNPFYALELARAMGDTTGAFEALPDTLTDLVVARVECLGADVGEALLAAACVPAPTVELVARATGADPEEVARMLEDAEDKGIIGIDGQRIRFTHPLLSRGVYTLATAARRRAMHRRLAATVDQPELRARHLALAATSADASTMESLDAAAESARARGAPAAAAEFLDLAIRLGGDTPRRRLRVASYHFSAGDTKRAQVLLEDAVTTMEPGPLQAEASSLLGFVHLFGDSFLEAAGVLERGLDVAGDDLRLRTQLLVTLAYARYNAGQFGRAARRIEEAITHAERLGQPILLSQALGLRAILGFLRGDGLDELKVARALGLEDADADMPMAFRPRMQHAMLLAWTGQLDHAHHEMESIRQRCIERGEENELIFVAVHGVLLDIWRGNFTDAVLISEDTTGACT